MAKKKPPPGVEDSARAAFEADAPARPKASPPKGALPQGTLKVRRIGNSLGVVLPKAVLARLGVGEGDQISVAAVEDEVRLKRADEDTAELMEMAEAIMRKRRKVLKALAQ